MACAKLCLLPTTPCLTYPLTIRYPYSCPQAASHSASYKSPRRDESITSCTRNRDAFLPLHCSLDGTRSRLQSFSFRPSISRCRSSRWTLNNGHGLFFWSLRKWLYTCLLWQCFCCLLFLMHLVSVKVRLNKRMRRLQYLYKVGGHKSASFHCKIVGRERHRLMSITFLLVTPRISMKYGFLEG